MQYGWVPYGKTDTSGPARRTTFVYNPRTDHWSAGTVMPDYRLSFGVAVLNDNLFAVGGYVFKNLANNNVTASNTNDKYTPISSRILALFPSPSVPEFSWLIILSILLTIPIALAMVRKRLKGNV